jgi:hypothetical protein
MDLGRLIADLIFFRLFGDSHPPGSEGDSGGVDLGGAADVVPFAEALPVTIAIHLWQRNGLLSSLSGTIVHVALATILTGS